ncbi:pyridoxamine 5'-phosphate oxidase family protein [Bacillus horti]|uniref:Pyridoxamine 5'-phosphate oxidase N-terminal domain-containing protein n=1 Tax=Caldalkalibacillus horti TaxID=77523 RepID=A0ABT9W3C9_9BACI|nr:pyridoxamine 5'-phosphate oxidase family protein [Bacillus horti]MDQ0167756.1 hypothetical protein [Bacillus horti]
MAKQFSEILPEHKSFIERQHLFFVASAPMLANGHVNISPKGYDSFKLLSSTEAAYLDLTGSGNETSAHITENGRITLMFISFDQKPLILRLYGKGEVILPDTERWDEYVAQFDPLPGARQIIYTKIHLVQTSCGFGIPYYTYEGDRDTLHKFALNKGQDGLEEYRQLKNSTTLDGLQTPLGKLQ